MATKKQIKKVENSTNAKAVKVAEKATEIKEIKVEAKVEAKKATKKAPAKKEVKTSLVVEYAGKQVEEKDMIVAVKNAWKAAGNKVADIKSMTLYVKPEENAIYYVINKTETGKVEF